jgi:nucleotide-binding universal stress UspA family protein
LAGGFERIVVGVDGSENSVTACKTAALLATKFHSSLTLLEVVPSERIRSALDKGLESQLELKAKQDVETVSAEIEKGGVKPQTEILRAQSSVVKAMVDYAAKNSDLIVLGTKGSGAFHKMLLGSVSSGVASHAQNSVLVVRKDGSVFRKILVCVDGSKNSSKATATAAMLVKATGATLTLLYVIHMPSFVYDESTTGSSIDTLEEDERDYGKKLLADAASVVKKEGIDAKQELLEEIQSPAVRITKYAETEGFDLIVLGGRGVHGFERLLLGSVAVGVLTYAHCSVLVVK